MRFVGMLRIKNESRWIFRVLHSLQPLCEQIYVLDDHSTDDTLALCNEHQNVRVFSSGFSGLDETRDKTWLLERITEQYHHDPDTYVIAVDGDEELEQGGQLLLRNFIDMKRPDAVSLKVIYLWNDIHTWRSDRLYGRFWRPSVFKLIPGKTEFYSTNAKGNLHCTNIPYVLIDGSLQSEVRLLHYGYLTAEMRAEKYAYYAEKVDPGNSREDFYRHINQGDEGGVPAEATLLHAGPLTLQRLE